MTTTELLTPQDVREAAAMVCETVGQRWHGTQLEDACDECAGAIRAMELPPSTGWQPVQTAPQTGELVLLWAAARDDLRGFVTIGAYHPNGGWCVDELREVTHWQPLPAPPETTP